MLVFTNTDEDPTTGALGGREAYFHHANARGDICGMSIPPSGPDAVIVLGTTYNNFIATVADIIDSDYPMM